MIELPAEANPLTEANLYNVLRSAASNDPLQIQTGTKQLQRWETERGYYALLQSIFLDKSLPFEVRYLAIIQLKNGVDKYWRKTGNNSVSKDDKSLIRSRLLESGINEADQKLALQNAVMIAKIVRYEFPLQWPNVITELVGLLRSSSLPGAGHLRLPRTLLVLLYVVKELSTGRLQRTRASLFSVTPEVFHVLGRLYFEKVQRWRAFIQQGGDDEGGAIEDIEQSQLAIKILRRLVIVGYEFPHRDKDVHEFWSLLRVQWGDFLVLVREAHSQLSSQVAWLLEKHILQMAKFHLEMARVHPSAFVMLPDSLALVRAYWDTIKSYGESLASTREASKAGTSNMGFAATEEKPFLERLSLKGLLLTRAVLKMVFHPTQTFKYRHPQEKEEKSQAIERVKQDLLTEETIREWADRTIVHYFTLTPVDLEEWEEQPEEWEAKEETGLEGYEFSIRSCAEKLFLDLAINFKSILVQPLLTMFQSTARPEVEDVLLKDSVYSAIGLAAPVIFQELDFDNFISSTLVVEVQKQQPGYKILRRRIAILLGQWISVKTSQSSRPLVYQIFRHLLDDRDPLNDLVVRVVAGRHFQYIASEWEFKADQFMPHADEVLTRLMTLVEEVAMTETKMGLLTSISAVVERLEHHITPYADRIVSLLPPLWQQSGDEHLMKQAILTLLSRLINSMKSESRRFHSLVLPIIKGAVEPNSDTQIYLLEESLELWSAIIIQTPSPEADDLLALAPYLFYLYELGPDTIRRLLEITESYILLAPSAMLSTEMRQGLFTSFTTLLASWGRESGGLVTHLIEVLIRAADALGGEAAIEIFASDMVRTGLLGALLSGIRSAWGAHCVTGPNRKDSSVEGSLETDYFAALARLMYASPRIFIGAAHMVADASAWNQNGQSQPAVQSSSDDTGMSWLLEEWFSHLDNIGDPARRKLMCLALTKMLDVGGGIILAKLQDMMTMWTDIVGELTEGLDDKSVDSLIYWDTDNIKASEPEAPEEQRRRDLTFSDPVHTVNVVQFIKDHLQQAIQQCGGENVFRDEWLVNVDVDVVQAFGKLGIM